MGLANGGCFSLAWIKQNAPKAYAAVRTFLTAKDYINFKLTGERRIDFCEASCSYMFDPQSLNWSQKLLRIFGVGSGFCEAGQQGNHRTLSNSSSCNTFFLTSP